ncbi:hypothetical protein HYX58_05665 [Candidatus Dependentiae bacterium]|nr:hypothetical protein [Candidatus Dependentiae bacterium]
MKSFRIIALFSLIVHQFSYSIDDCFEFLSRCQPVEEHEKTAQFFMMTRPIYRNLAAQWATGWRDFVYEKCGNRLASLQAIGIYQQSQPMHKISAYFLFNRLSSLVVKGDATFQPTLRDVRAEWIGLPSNFSGTFAINPKQQQGGVWLEYNQDLKKLVKHKFFKPFWLSFALPIQFIENDLQVTQTNVQNTGPNNQDLISAFNQGLWRYARFNPSSQKKAGVSDITAKLGCTFLSRDGIHVGLYSLFLIPLSGGQNAKFVFDPYLGYNGHFGFGIGANFQLPLNNDTDCKLLALFFDIENIYLARRSQHRIFDLLFKPWSRYLPFNKIDGTSNIPGPNILTFKTTVHPYNFVDLTAGFRCNKGIFDAEIGYNLWAHGNEKVELDEPFPAGTYGIAGSAPFKTSSESTINNQASDDASFTPIAVNDLNFITPQARAAVVNKVHIAAGITIERCLFSFLAGVGGLYEFPTRNTALTNWGVWVKFGGTY